MLSCSMHHLKTADRLQALLQIKLSLPLSIPLCMHSGLRLMQKEAIDADAWAASPHAWPTRSLLVCMMTQPCR